MTYAEFFAEFKGKFAGADVSDINEHLAFQFNICDEECGGSFYVEIKDGELSVEPYEYYDRDAMFSAKPEILMGIAENKVDAVDAYLKQQLKVEGNIDKALRIKEIIEMKQQKGQNFENEKTKAQKAVGKIVQSVAKKVISK